MAQQKRARPAFSPPRPGKNKSKVNKPNTSAAAKNAKAKRSSTSGGTKRARKASPVAIDRSDSEASTNDDETENIVEQSDTERPSDAGEEERQSSSPEPDFVLAEVVHEKPVEDCAVSLPLIHRIMHDEWQDKEKTKLSLDAREVIGKYVETFVREAIMRSSFERKERGGNDDGWLEVVDLERIAAQLCLDF